MHPTPKLPGLLSSSRQSPFFVLSLHVSVVHSVFKVPHGLFAVGRDAILWLLCLLNFFDSLIVDGCASLLNLLLCSRCTARTLRLRTSAV